MIIRAGDEAAVNLRVFDTLTGEELHHITEVDTETGIAKGYVRCRDGFLAIGGELQISEYPGTVRVEYRKD